MKCISISKEKHDYDFYHIKHIIDWCRRYRRIIGVLQNHNRTKPDKFRRIDVDSALWSRSQERRQSADSLCQRHAFHEISTLAI
jgi:hypothetical protein